MKFFAAIVLLVACAHADVSHIVGNPADLAATIVRSEGETKPDGFVYAYETSNGIRSTVNGIIKNVNAENPAQEVTGEYSHVGPDGVTYQVTFIANEDGFQPQGAHLPTPPPVPEAIQRSLAYIEAHPQADAKYNAPAQAYKAAAAVVSRPVAQAYNAVPAAVPARVAPRPSKFPGRF